MPDCSEIRPLLSAFGDGELEPPELLSVARHLAECTDCERETADFSSLGTQLRDTLESTVDLIPLAGFTAAVQARISHLRPSLWSRFGNWLESLDERLNPGLSLASAAIAMAALTAIILTPYVRQYATRHSVQVAASAPAHRTLAQAAVAPVAVAPVEDALAEDSHAIISRLESANPAVAVWSEPRSDTTVIWVPDQQSGR
ncbi:MAG TPA: zf-HC2 domain-containing protein [Candidatus Binataceae bacterium]|nr:zf-HC2 domain-containing protein [Candidatus Binataceae bacterium]